MDKKNDGKPLGIRQVKRARGAVTTNVRAGVITEKSGHTLTPNG